MTTRLTIRKPDDWHLHVRDGAMLKAVMPFTARHFPGLFNAPVAIETYARVFEEEGALDKLEAFASLSGPRHYRLPPNEERITLEKSAWTAPEEIKGRRAGRESTDLSRWRDDRVEGDGNLTALAEGTHVVPSS
jgi:dihydroorotase